MSGDNNYYFGDNVTMHGGQGNTGIVKNQGVPGDGQAVPPALHDAVQELLRQIQDLRSALPDTSADARTIDDSLPGISADTTAPPEERHRALIAVAGIAATVGTIGQPVLTAVNKVLELLGAR